MSKFHISTSPLTGTVYCGRVIARGGRSWVGDKTDVTGEACAAVAQHALHRGGTTVVNANGVPTYEITVRQLLKTGGAP